MEFHPILALSGGPDSVYLLHQLLKKGEKPILAHLNHQLRGQESDADERFVRELGKKNGLTVEIDRKNVAAYAKRHKLSLETAARELRYAFLEKIRQKHNAQSILTAHTLDDNLETVLMNELRASLNETTLRARIGMRDKQGFIERPLLNIRKKTILATLHRDNIPYRLDSSNTDLRYRRNWIRHVLIPRLLKKNPHLYKDFTASRKKALREYDQLTKWAEQWLNKNSPIQKPSLLSPLQTTDYRLQTSPLAIPLPKFTKLNIAQQQFILQHIYETLYGSTQNLNHAKLEEVRKLLIAGKTGKWKPFGEKAGVRIEYGKGMIEKTDLNLKSLRGHHARTRHRRGSALVPINSFKKKSTFAFQTTLSRSWRPGDRFQPSGMRGTKKIQDYFTDLKIPRSQRHTIPIWVIPSVKNRPEQIVAVGGRFDEKFRHLANKIKVGNLRRPRVQ